MSHLEEQFALVWRAAGGCPFVTEYRFAPPRRWRFDWSAREVKEHIDTGQAPTRRETLVDEHYAPEADAEDAAALVHRALVLAREPHAEHGLLLELRVRVVAVYAAAESEKEAA